MILDFHTHIFPPEVVQGREEYIRRDSTFAELYVDPKAKLATAEGLLAEMERTGVEQSVVLGFAWSTPDLCRRHNDYLLASAARSNGRLIPFCTLQPQADEAAWQEAERCAGGGARGLGELRPHNQGYRLDNGAAARLLATVAQRYRLILLFHVSEPIGRSYPGKEGLSLADLYAFCVRHPTLTIVAAHWGGGLAFYYPFLRGLPGPLKNVYFDTAATPFLYRPEVYRFAAHFLGADRLLLGSDFPLVSQSRQLEAIQGAALPEEMKELILGGNGRRLLGEASSERTA